MILTSLHRMYILGLKLLLLLKFPVVIITDMLYYISVVLYCAISSIYSPIIKATSSTVFKTSSKDNPPIY